MTKKQPPVTSFEKLFLFIVLALATYLRLWKIRDYMTFLGDEGRDALVVKHMIVDFDIPFIGPTASVGGFFLGPIYYYFMAPFLALFKLDPVGPAVMVALFGIATVYLVYKVGKEFFSTEAGLIAALLYTVSPVIISQSRSSWNPNIVPFFSLLYIYGLFKAVTTHNKWWYLVVGICIGIGVQLHYLFTFLIPVGIVYVFLYDRGVKRIKNYLFAMGGAIVTLVPFFGFEIKNNFLNSTTLVSYVFKSDEVKYGSGNAIKIIQEVTFRLYARLAFLFPPVDQVEKLNTSFVSNWTLLVTIILVVSVGFLLFRIVTKRSKADVLMGLWLFFGIGLFSFYQRDIYDHYFVILSAVPFLLIGYLLGSLWSNKLFKIVSIVLLCALFIFNWEERPAKSSANKQVEQMKGVSQKVFEEAGSQQYNFALITTGNSDHAYRYFLDIWGNPPVTIENSQIDPERESVTEQLFVVCEYKDCQPLGNSLWEVAGFGQAEIDEVWELRTVMVYRLVPIEPEVVQ